MQSLKLLFMALLVLIPIQCHATVTHDTKTSGGTNIASSFTMSLTTSGPNEIVIVEAYYNLNTAVTSVTGGSGITWSSVARHAVSGTSLAIYQGLCPTQQTAQTITVQLSGNCNAAGLMDSYSGANMTSPVEAILDTVQVASTTWSGNVTTLTANALVVAVVGDNTTFGIDTVTAGTGYTKTMGQSQTNGTVTWSENGEFANAVTASPGLVTATFTSSFNIVADMYVMSIAAAPSYVPSCWAVY